jgi:hypothetical protein
MHNRHKCAVAVRLYLQPTTNNKQPHSHCRHRRK